MPNDLETPISMRGTEEVVVPPAEPVPPAPEPGPAPTPEQVPPADQPEPTRDTPDYKEKFSESAREAQALHGKNQQLEDRIRELTSNKPPTEEELKAQFPNWDYLSDAERMTLARQVAMERRLAAQQLALADMLEEKRWNEELANITATYPAIAGREAEFRAFVYKPSHFVQSADGRKVPMDIGVLARAFLFEHPTQTPAQPKPTPGAMQRGSGAPEAPKPGGLTDEQAEAIRKTDPKRYNELVRKGVIK